jgi:hypothetical protein
LKEWIRMPDLQKVADLLRQVAEELVSGLPEGEEKEAGLNMLGRGGI